MIMEGVKVLSPQQCTECGITRFQAWWRVRQMIRRGELPQGSTLRDAAEALALQLSEDPRFAPKWDSLLQSGWDWEAFIVALERILELLAKFIPIFISFF
jgi:hypothetical protein